MDKKAKTILFKTYWNSGGWNSIYETKPDDFEYAKSKGVMFDPITITIDEIVIRLKALLKSVSHKTVTDAFLCSLTNKRLDWRSSLASYTNAIRVVEGIKNTNDPWEHYGQTSKDLNVLNFERIKWGGVRHYQALYNYFDLEQISKEVIPTPTLDDIQTLKNILETIDSSQIGDPPSKLRDNLKGVFKGSKNDCGTMMEILGSADILQAKNFDRKEPGKHDWHFPLYWRGEDKYNKQNVKHHFGIYGIE
jgi:hypothetical protein